MYRYKYNTSYHHKSRMSKRMTVVATLFSVVVLVGVVGIAIDTYLQSLKKQQPTSQPVHSIVQGASISLFRTEYFQFQTDDSWKEVPVESKENHYVYRSYNGTLVEHDLVIDINKPTEDLLSSVRTTHIMPVQIEANGRLTIEGGAGEHCSKAMPKNSTLTPTWVVQKQVKFVCSVDAVLYEVKVGVIGGGTDMTITRPNGTKARYTITYRNLKYKSDDVTLRSIVETFLAL